MRTQLFRVTVPVDGDDQDVLVKDVDGVPFTLFIENVDTRARARTRYGSKNANLQFEAVDAGDAGNDLSVVVGDVSDNPRNQAFAVSAYAGVVTVTLATDGDGRPTMTADAVAEEMNADTDTAAVVRTTRAPGSDGSAVFGVPAETDPELLGSDVEYQLEGGADAATLGDVTVKTSPTGAPNFSGPWETLSDTTFNDLSAGSVKSLDLTAKPIKGLMVTVDAPYATVITLTGVAQRRI